jgi:hypothetical protein
MVKVIHHMTQKQQQEKQQQIGTGSGYYNTQHSTPERYTPIDLYRKLDQEFHFSTDPCTGPTNRLGCKIFYAKQDDGLTKP